MASTLQIYDRTNSVVLFDLNDTTGANAADNGYSSTRMLHNPNWGAPAFQYSRFEPPQRDGGTTTFSRAGLTEARIPLRITATTYDNLSTAVGRLSTYLAQGCTIKWVPDGSADTLYYLIEPSMTPALIGGQNLALYQVLRLFQTPDAEFELALTRQPFAYGATLTSAANLLTNATLARDGDATGRPDGWTWSSTTNITAESISSSVAAGGHYYQFNIATTSQRQLLQVTPNSTVVAGETWTMSGYVRAVAVAGTPQVQAMIEYQTNAGAAVNTITGTLLPITTAWQRYSVSGVASATATKAQGGLRWDNGDGTAVDIQTRNFKFEKTSSATPFFAGSETGVVDPAPASGIGRVFPIWNPGDAEAPLVITAANATKGPDHIYVGLLPERTAPGSGQLATYLNNAAVLQCESFTPTTDTATNTAANSSPGTGTTGLKTTFVTTAFTDRATLTLTTAATLAMLRGRSWFVVLRGVAADATYTGLLRADMYLGSTGLGGLAFRGAATATAASTTVYVDIPLGVASFADIPMDGISMKLLASRTSGTGNWIWDCLTFCPIPEVTRLTPHSASGAIGASVVGVLDGENHSAYFADTNGNLTQTADTDGPAGLVAPPGLSMLYMIAGNLGTTVDVGSVEDARSESLTLATSLTPRYFG